MNMKHLLFISHWESLPAEWTVKQFNSLEEAQTETYNRDLTKEYFIIPIDELVSMLQKLFEDE